MATGDITTTYLGEALTSGTVITALTSLNVGGATAAADTASLFTITIGKQVHIWKLARTA